MDLSPISPVYALLDLVLQIVEALEEGASFM
jgi:hypothetical protein